MSLSSLYLIVYGSNLRDVWFLTVMSLERLKVCVSKAQHYHYYYGGHSNGEINIQKVFIECLVCD